jgi:pimeloyl-ACP methyl ester carboxylesterase
MRFLSAAIFKTGNEESLGKVHTAAGEVVAFLRQTFSLHQDVTEPVIPTGVEPGDDVVVFMHGLMATAGCLRPLRAAVTRIPGVHDAALTWPPGPGVIDLAERLARVVAEIPEHARIHFVGHSLGGVVTRWWALESGDPRVVQTISMASPFGGVAGADWLGFQGAKDLTPDSPILRKIRLHPRAESIPHLSIIAGADPVTRGPVTHALPSGELMVLPARGHNALIYDPEVEKAVVGRVLLRRGKVRGA